MEWRRNCVQAFARHFQSRLRLLIPDISSPPPENFLGITLRVMRQSLPGSILADGCPKCIGTIPDLSCIAHRVVGRGWDEQWILWSCDRTIYRRVMSYNFGTCRRNWHLVFKCLNLFWLKSRFRGATSQK